jgi:hypothetical protein
MPTKVTDAMKTLMPNPDSTISFSTKSAKVRLAGTGRLRPALLLGAALVAAIGVSSAQTVAPTPQTVIVADFNGDGIPDALVESSVTPTATIAFGSVPYGTFASGSKAVTFPAACTSFNSDSLVVGDFNGDGIADIAYFCNGTSGIMPGNGDGTFGTTKSLAGAISAKVVAGDFNKDGKLDLVVFGLTFGPNTTALGTLQFFAGNGDGTFAAGVNTVLDTFNYTAPVAADLNGDGYPDIVLLSVPDGGAPSVNVFGNNQDGTFGAITGGVATANTVANVSTGAATILAGNFFGPQTVDLAVVSTGANGGFSVLQNTSTATAYSFNDPVTIPYANLTGAQAGKFTGSGFTDVVASNGTKVAVLTNDGKGNLAAGYSALTLASTSSLFAVADANGDGYADVYTALLPQSGAMQLGVALTTGSATATSQPFSLAIGTRAIGAAWAGNVNFTGSNPTGSQIVVGVASVTTLASSKNPSLFGDSVTFTVKVGAGLNSGSTTTPTGTIVLLDGTNTLASGAVDDTGTYTFTTTTLSAATHTIAANYSGDALYSTSTATLSQVVNAAVPVVSSFTPSTATLGSGATTITVTGTGFIGTSVVQVNGTAILTTLVNPTTLTATIPASYFTTVGTLAITVYNPAPVDMASTPVNFTVTAPAPIPIVVVPPTSQPGTQPSITLSLSQPYPVDITATVTLNFAASTTPAIDDPNIVFEATGSRTENVTIPAGSVTVPPILLQAGTVAGTITVPITLIAGGANVTPASLQPGVIVVPPSIPSISSVTTTRKGNQLTVVMHGFSNTREMVNAKFHFTPAAGASLDTTDLTIVGDTIFNANWFQTTTSYQYGSTFTYTQIFNTSDDATAIGSVDVTLTNTIGASDMKTTQ